MKPIKRLEAILSQIRKLTAEADQLYLKNWADDAQENLDIGTWLSMAEEMEDELAEDIKRIKALKVKQPTR